MRWPVFLVSAYVVLALTRGLPDLLALPSLGGITPSFAAVLAVFIALFAGRSAALWGCFFLGLLIDLAVHDYPRIGVTAHGLCVPGPYALGYTAGALIVLQVRTIVFRRRIITLAFLSLVQVLVATLVTTIVFLLRDWIDEEILYPTSESVIGTIMQGIGSAVYTALLAIPMGWLLLQTAVLWRFPAAAQTRSGW